MCSGGWVAKVYPIGGAARYVRETCTGGRMATSDKHLARIDVLRGVAILMVLVFHAWVAAFGRDQFDWGGLIDGTVPHPGRAFLLTYPVRFGNAGVSLFFVISGYVIHRSYLRDAQFTWRGYVARRFWRIYPAYLVALVAVAVWLHREQTRDFALHAALAHNVSARTFFGINPSLWSLAVEVQLYLLYPLAVAARRAWGPGGMLAVGVAASTVWRLAAAATTDLPGPQTYHIWLSPVALWPDWLLGAFLADRHAGDRRAFARPLAWAAVGVAVVVLGEVVRPLRVVQFSAASLAAAALMEMYLYRRGSPGRLARVVAAVGLCSYSLYLIHQPLMLEWVRLLNERGVTHPVAQVVGFVPYILAAVGVAWLMYLVVEKGGTRLGRWLATAGGFGRRQVAGSAGGSR